MVVAQDACSRINNGSHSRMGSLIGKTGEANGAANGAAPEANHKTNGAAPEVNHKTNGSANGAAPVAAPEAAPVAAPEAAPEAEEEKKSANKANETAGGKRKGGYRPTKKDKTALKKLKQGKSIGFTMRSSLKAKGLLRRANGTMRLSAKYKKN